MHRVDTLNAPDRLTLGAPSGAREHRAPRHRARRSRAAHVASLSRHHCPLLRAGALGKGAFLRRGSNTSNPRPLNRRAKLEGSGTALGPGAVPRRSAICIWRSGDATPRPGATERIDDQLAR
jgi:hypothetical protein